jgi:hypothetical protein
VTPEPIAVTLRVIESLDQLRLSYLIGGSLASAMQGEPRSTVDADIVADMRMEDAAPLAHALAGEFYVDEESIREAIQTCRSFNVIHLNTGFKVDIFVRKPRPFDDAQFRRRTRQIIATDPARAAFVASPEDTILAKLEWFRLGGETSDRQWRDILGILKAQGERLDRIYLHEQSQSLGVRDLLERATKQIE